MQKSEVPLSCCFNRIYVVAVLEWMRARWVSYSRFSGLSRSPG